MSATTEQRIPTGVVVCLKWSRRPGTHDDDERFSGVSQADQAALELGLQVADRLHVPLTAMSVGPSGADRVLRDALACGATRARRIDAGTDHATGDLTSAEVARQLARHVGADELVLCGDHSMDRGTGSVPAFLAHRLGVAQALGLVGVDLDAADAGRIGAVRRLDGGRREVLRLALPCLLSVEGSVATLRRASLRGALAARTAHVEVAALAAFTAHPATPVVTPYRPRARALPAPSGDIVLDRLHALLDAGATPGRGETVELEPAAAAARIVAALRTWGYLPGPM